MRSCVSSVARPSVMSTRWVPQHATRQPISNSYRITSWTCWSPTNSWRQSSPGTKTRQRVRSQSQVKVSMTSQRNNINSKFWGSATVTVATKNTWSNKPWSNITMSVIWRSPSIWSRWSSALKIRKRNGSRKLILHSKRLRGFKIDSVRWRWLLIASKGLRLLAVAIA